MTRTPFEFQTELRQPLPDRRDAPKERAATGGTKWKQLCSQLYEKRVILLRKQIFMSLFLTVDLAGKAFRLQLSVACINTMAV